MSAATKDLNPLVYIDKIQRLYPCGVSVSSIVVPVTVPHVSPTSSNIRVVCMVVTTPDRVAEVSSTNDTLLEAICGKGLQLAKGEYVVKRITSKEFCAELLASDVQRHAPAVVIVFGYSTSPGTVTTVGSARVLYAHALESIASDVSMKKEFWRQLQESVLPVVKER